MRNHRLLVGLTGLILLLFLLGCSMFPTTTAVTTTTTVANSTTYTTTSEPTTTTTTTTELRNVRIEIVQSPDKVVYELGEMLDLTGLAVHVVLSNGESLLLASGSLEIIGYDPNLSGMQTIIVRYDRFAKTFLVYVKEAPQNVPTVSLELTPPDKTVYKQNEPLDLAGLVVALHGIDQTVVYLVEGQFAISSVDTSTLGVKTIVVTVLGLEATFEIVVESALPTLTGYYASASQLDGTALVAALRVLLNTGLTMKTYGDSRYLLNITDRDPQNASNVILVYLGTSVSGVWDGGTTWNREHVWPQSLMGCSADNSSTDRCADLHNLKPANPSINSSRGNKYFGLTTTTTTFAPRVEVRGDLARILLYMVVMYADLNLSSTYVDQPLTMGLLSVLLLWHEEDPVDAFEQNRNEVIYDQQGNRNPFIDHPYLVDLIW